MKSKTLQRIITVLLIAAYLMATLTIIATAANGGATSENPGLPKYTPPEITVDNLLKTIYDLIFGSVGAFLFFFFAWATIKVVKICHFFKLFTIAKQTEAANANLEKIVQLQQRQLDLLIHGKVKEDPPKEDPPEWKSYFE